MIIKLHELLVKITFNQEEEWEFWRWKLDPFRISDYGSCPDICIDLSCENNELVNKPLYTDSAVYSEKSGFYTYTTYQKPDGTMLWCMDRPAKKQRILSYKISSEWDKISLVEDYSNTRRQLPFEVLNRLLPTVFLKQSAVQLHGVLLEDTGRGIVICADSGIGKTTHARLWRDHRNAFIIDGDRASCIKDPKGWTAFGVPWCGTSGEYMNRSVPISAIVILERGDINEASCLSGIDPFFAVMPHLQYPVWNPQLRDQGMDLVQDLVDCVPVFRLRCRPDQEAVEVLEKAIEERISHG